MTGVQTCALPIYKGDWIELYNSGSDSIDVDGLFITDDFTEPGKHRMISAPSEKIPPGGFKLLLADGHELAGTEHLNFKLSGNGEQVGVFQFNGTDWNLLDGYTFLNQTSKTSWARIPDGGESFILTALPTPSASNKTLEYVTSSAAFPNPFKDLLFIDFPENTDSVLLTDLMGRDQQINLSVAQPYDVSALAPGVYLLQVKTTTGRQMIRVVKR